MFNVFDLFAKNTVLLIVVTQVYELVIWRKYINERNDLYNNTFLFQILPQRLWYLYINEIGGFRHRSNIQQGTAQASSGIPFHFLSDPENPDCVTI